MGPSAWPKERSFAAAHGQIASAVLDQSRAIELDFTFKLMESFAGVDEQTLRKFPKISLVGESARAPVEFLPRMGATGLPALCVQGRRMMHERSATGPHEACPRSILDRRNGDRGRDGAAPRGVVHAPT